MYVWIYRMYRVGTGRGRRQPGTASHVCSHLSSRFCCVSVWLCVRISTERDILTLLSCRDISSVFECRSLCMHTHGGNAKGTSADVAHSLLTATYTRLKNSARCGKWGGGDAQRTKREGIPKYTWHALPIRKVEKM